MSEFRFSEPTRAGQTASVLVEVPADLKYLEGHFPGDPIVPGVAQVVALAQRQAEALFPELGAVVGMRRLKFMEALRPGDSLELHFEQTTPPEADDTKLVFRVTRGAAECSRGTLLYRR